MNKILIFLMVVCSSVVYGQTSEKYNSEYENFYRAEDLFVKEQYAAARKEFRAFIDGFDKVNDPTFVKAQYYEAISALELYNNDAVPLLEAFNRNYPESIYKTDIYFRLGKFYYQKKDFDKALAWFNKLSVQDVDEEDKDEFYFKVGYANFQEKKFDEARNAFYEVKDGTSEYAAPALYYYSHIAYQNKNYQTALEGFLKLENDEKFGKVVPYYIAQIYYLQGKYNEVTKYAEKLTGENGVANEKDMNQLIGDAFFRTEKYDEAVPFLEAYDKQTKTSRGEDYRLGYAYYKSRLYKKAVAMFDRVKSVEDSLGQVAFYHIAECMLKLDNKISARSAFEGAAFINADPKIQEDALYNYAIISYQLDINPYDEAVEAFELYLNKYPNSPRKDDVYQYLVNVYMSTNNYDKALSSLDKIPNKDVRLKTAYQLLAFNQGVQRFQSDEYLKSIQSFNLVSKYPIDADVSGRAIFWIADANYRIRNFEKAIKGYQDFILLPPTTAKELRGDAHYNIGYAYLNKQQLTLAIQSFRSYIQTNPKDKNKKADACMRIADSYFVLKENQPAVQYYQDALALNAGYQDQALFYMAKTYGYMGRNQDKLKHLLDIINNYKESKYIQNSVFEVAKTYNSLGQLDKALQYFKMIIFDYPSSLRVVDAKIYCADIYYKQGNRGKAIDEYEKILTEYGSDNLVCERASRGLIEIYISSGNPEKAEEIGARYPCAKFSSDEQEDLYYLPAMKEYEEKNYQKCVPLFEKYISKFPSGRYAVDVRYYMGDAHYELGNLEQSTAIYMEALEGQDNGFTELAAARVAHYLYTEERYDEVIKYYVRLEKVSSSPDVIFNAQLGLMRSHFIVKNWANAIEYSQKVLNSSQINNTHRVEANYAKGMSNYYLSNLDQAKSALVWLIKNTTTVKAAEARFTLADIFYQQGHLDDADDEISALLKQKPAYNYWIAKGLILRTRVLIQKDDLFQAEQTLKSVIDHYPVSDDGILDEANILWEELMQLKSAQKTIEPENNTIIEIDENDGGQ